METCKPSKPKIALAIVFMLLLLATSVIPMDRQITGLQFIIDLKPTIQNLLHIPAYAVLSIIYLQIFKNYRLKRWQRNFLALLCSAIFGILNEAIQFAIPGRYAGLIDLGLNLVGAILGVIIFSIAAKSKPGLIRRMVCE